MADLETSSSFADEAARDPELSGVSGAGGGIGSRPAPGAPTVEDRRWGLMGSSFSLRSAYALLGPLLERFRRGEGALLAVNAVVIWFQRPGLWTGLASSLLSLIVIALLYEFNDLHDAPSDGVNPKKNRTLIRVYLDHRREQATILWLAHAGTVALAYFLLGGQTALTVAALFGVNILYSTIIKGVPFLDVAVVGVWGGLYVAVSGAQWNLCLLVGVMTSITHVYQVLVDRDVDAANEIPTTAVFSQRGTTALLGIVVVLLYAMAAYQVSPLWALLAFPPFFLHLAIDNTEVAWMLSRACFAALILLALGIPGGAS